MENPLSNEKENYKTLTFEFKINIKHINRPSKHYFMMTITKEPRIRQNLILEYQLRELMESDKTIIIKRIAGWLGMTYRRIVQIMDILYLAPKIQEKIIFSEGTTIYHISERKIQEAIKKIF